MPCLRKCIYVVRNLDSSMQSFYDLESEKIISDLLLKEGWADSIH
jgi:hypothetical protein